MTQPAAGLPALHTIGTRVMVCWLVLALGGCAEPFIVLAGEELAGTVSDPPVDWTDANAHEIVQLETKPDEPYSVNIWMVGIESDVYVATGDDDTNWTRHIDHNPDVRLRLGEVIYELEAHRVLDERERRAVAAAYVEKYGLDAEDNWVLDGQIFRLDRR